MTETILSLVPELLILLGSMLLLGSWLYVRASAQPSKDDSTHQPTVITIWSHKGRRTSDKNSDVCRTTSLPVNVLAAMPTQQKQVSTGQDRRLGGVSEG